MDGATRVEPDAQGGPDAQGRSIGTPAAARPEIRKPEARTLIRRAFEGESLILDGADYTLHELTQIAVALQPEANLAIRHAKIMSPIERASIATAARGRIVFL